MQFHEDQIWMLINEYTCGIGGVYRHMQGSGPARMSLRQAGILTSYSEM